VNNQPGGSGFTIDGRDVENALRRVYNQKNYESSKDLSVKQFWMGLLLVAGFLITDIGFMGLTWGMVNNPAELLIVRLSLVLIYSGLAIMGIILAWRLSFASNPSASGSTIGNIIPYNSVSAVSVVLIAGLMLTGWMIPDHDADVSTGLQDGYLDNDADFSIDLDPLKSFNSPEGAQEFVIKVKASGDVSFESVRVLVESYTAGEMIDVQTGEVDELWESRVMVKVHEYDDTSFIFRAEKDGELLDDEVNIPAIKDIYIHNVTVTGGSALRPTELTVNVDIFNEENTLKPGDLKVKVVLGREGELWSQEEYLTNEETIFREAHWFPKLVMDRLNPTMSEVSVYLFYQNHLEDSLLIEL